MLRNLEKFSIAMLVAVSLLLVVLISCEQKDVEKEVKDDKKARVLRIVIGSMITPKEGYTYYRRLLNYIGEKLGRPIELVDRANYAETSALLKSGGIDVAFVCGRPYVDGHDDFGLELLVVPQAYGKTVYYSYLIVHKDSPIKSIDELRGKTFAFVDPLSNSGKLVPTYRLAKMNETPDSFFENHIYTYAHDKSIKAVARKLVNGAAVDSLIWEYGNRTNPELTSKTRIIWKSPPYGIPPVVVRPGVDIETKNMIKKVLLNIHKDNKGKKILKGMMIEKFVIGSDSAYDSIREMKVWIAQQKKQ